MMDNHYYHKLLTQQLTRFFERCAAGKDVSPAMRYQLEGYMQAGLDLNILDEPALLQLKKSIAQQVYGENAPNTELWYKPVALPAIMQRAPVKPSTK